MTVFTKVGFTGSREEPSDYQKAQIRKTLSRLFDEAASVNVKPEFHHGDCVGSDAYAAGEAKKLGYLVISHPPKDTKLQAYAESDEVLPAKPYLDRNRDIVEASEIVLATPSKPQSKRGGTWFTVEYADEQDRTVHLFER